MKEQVSLTYAKQNFKRNIFKYGVDLSFENAILEYYLNKEEIKNLYEYAIKNVEMSERDKYNINYLLEQYTN